MSSKLPLLPQGIFIALPLLKWRAGSWRNTLSKASTSSGWPSLMITRALSKIRNTLQKWLLSKWWRRYQFLIESIFRWDGRRRSFAPIHSGTYMRFTLIGHLSDSKFLASSAASIIFKIQLKEQRESDNLSPLHGLFSANREKSRRRFLRMITLQRVTCILMVSASWVQICFRE